MYSLLLYFVQKIVQSSTMMKSMMIRVSVLPPKLLVGDWTQTASFLRFHNVFGYMIAIFWFINHMIYKILSLSIKI
jgi:hypothetical protein